MSFKIGEREELTPIAKGRGKIYDAMIAEVRQKKTVGAYPVSVEGLNAKQLYAALSNRLKKAKDLRPRIRNEKVYLELCKVSK
jgi:hypothetical protein